VANLTLSSAKAALTKGHCAVGAVSKAKSKAFAKGRIEHASATAGAVFVSGTKIGLTESSSKTKKAKAKKHHKKSSAKKHKHGKK
jgi:beta-lactam-binding protein with PASTA domain